MTVAFHALGGGVFVRVRHQGRDFSAWRNTKRQAWNWVWALATKLEHDHKIDARLQALQKGRAAA